MLRHLCSRLLTYTCLNRATQVELSLRILKYPLASNYGELLHVRHKYVTSGVQGRRNSKVSPRKFTEEEEEEDFDEDPEEKLALKDR